jgi:hypothetical protein
MFPTVRDRVKRRLRDESDLGSVPHEDFLVYLMGPYKTYSVEDMVPDDVAVGDVAIDFGEWDGTRSEGDGTDAVEFLQSVRDELREDVGVNAFLAIDPDVPLSEMDAAEQTKAFADACNAVAFVIPEVGDNLGVGIETGLVVQYVDESHESRIGVFHENTVSSAMLDGLGRSWKAHLYSWGDPEQLAKQLRTFVLDTMVDESSDG